MKILAEFPAVVIEMSCATKYFTPFPPGGAIFSIIDHKDANIAMKTVSERQGVSPENIPGLQLLSGSYQVSLELLAVYHKWLEQNL